jgi:lipid-A-disaccharide synthase-like uncharacterized protein
MTSEYWLYGLGFLAQMLFGLRMVSQWISSEIAGYSVSPTFFWKMSLLAAIIFLIYGVLRTDIVIVIGQSLSYYIYLRNLRLKDEWSRMSHAVRYSSVILPIPIILWAFLYRDGTVWFSWQLPKLYQLLMVAGLTGQFLLSLRFFIQWLYAERFQVSFFPPVFWILSWIGAFMVMTYALYRGDPVLSLSQMLALLVYSRNIALNRKSIHAGAV